MTLAQSQLVVDAIYEFLSVRIDEDGHSFDQLVQIRETIVNISKKVMNCKDGLG